MASRYEKMGLIITDIDRSAIVMSLKESDLLSVVELEQEANKKLSVIGKALTSQKHLKEHLKILEQEGIIVDNGGRFQLTGEGLKIVQELTSR